MTAGWDRSEFFALAARLNANGVDEARPPHDDETAGVYLAALYGWVMDACQRIPKQPKRAARWDEHLIDHDAEALLQGKNLDPDLRGVEFTYKRGSF